MMKHLARIVAIMILSVFVASAVAPVRADVAAETEMRGLWVASVLNIDYPSKPSADPEILKNEAVKILDDARKTGFNAIFLQIRPTADALYRSDIFPWSKYLTGVQGKAPDGGFDPLAFWIAEAHARGMELHAWINPFRITRKAANEATPTVDSLSPGHPARLHPDWVVRHSDGNLYFDPGIPEVRRLVVDGVLELAGRYDIDGIHFDDYFYPGKDFNDSKTYAAYGGGFADKGEWRRTNITTLVSEVSKAVRASGRNLRFGVSPFGIWANKSSNPLGSDTKGLESNYDHFADARKWVKDELVDYMAPQLYWNIGYPAADYAKLLAWWKNVASGTSVDLYIGHAAYKAGNTDASSPWHGVAEIERQMFLNRKYPEVKGSIFYNYSSIAGNPALGAVIKAVYDRIDGRTPAVPLSVSRPSGDITTGYDKYYLNGASDPGKPLYLNGSPVENRSSKGYFGILVNLAKGSNVFTFSQEGSYVTRIINRPTGTDAPRKMDRPEITASSVFPQSQEYRMPGEKITLSCIAPAGSKVSVKIGGKTYAMKTSSKSGGLYAAKFTYTYTVPSYTGTPRIVDLGAPLYVMNYKGTVKSRKAPAKIGVIMSGAPFYAEVSDENIDTYESPVSGNGAAYELSMGMVDYVTGMTGNYARLSLGLWVKKTGIRTFTSKVRLNPEVTSAEYRTGEKWDVLKLSYASSLAAVASFNGSRLTVGISAAKSGVLPALPDDSLFSGVSFANGGNRGNYVLTLKPGRSIDGYYIEKTADGIILHVKKPAKAAAGSRPLAGLAIMLDPGHGGSDTGAIGPLGAAYPEKAINLDTAIKLKAELELLGADVIMTRSSDTALSLEDRLDASRRAKPDMFLSIHANSMADNVDISKIYGFSAYYKETMAKQPAEALLSGAVNTGRVNRGVKWANFYVIRGTWTPSVLIENGFVPNPHEFELISGERGQAEIAKALADAIVEYFKNN